MGVSDAQYASFVDRVVACREAEDRAKADTKALYAEIAEAGEDKTAIGIIVRELRMTTKDRTKAEFREAAVDDGRGRYYRGKASHVRVREERSEEINSNASSSGASSAKTAAEEINHDPVTGEIIEEHESTAVDPAGEGGKNAPALPADTNEPEGPDQSTAALMEVRDNTTEGIAAPQPLDPEAGTTPPATGRSPVGTNSEAVTLASDDEGNPALSAMEEATASASSVVPANSNISDQFEIAAGGVQIAHRGVVLS